MSLLASGKYEYNQAALLFAIESRVCKVCTALCCLKGCMENHCFAESKFCLLNLGIAYLLLGKSIYWGSSDVV